MDEADESNRWQLPDNETAEPVPLNKVPAIMDNFLSLRASLNSFDVPGMNHFLTSRKKARQ